MSLIPDHGAAGTTVTIDGAGYVPDGVFSIVGAPVTTTAATDANGSFMTSFVVPATVAPAGYTVTVSDGASSANGWFVVEPPASPTGPPSIAIDSDIVRPGDRVGVAGSGWDRCRLGDVTVRIGAATILTVTPDEGWFKESFVVPSVPDGKYEVVATDACGNSATALLVVNPGFRLPVP